MKSKILLVCIVLFVLAMPGFSQSTTVVKLAIGDWAPYTSETEKDGKLTEIIVSEAFKLEGITVEYGYYPWKRSMEMVVSGEADGTFPWNKTADRERDFFISKNSMVKDNGVYFYMKSRKFDWNTIEDLKKYRVGVTIGYKNEAYYKEKGIKADVSASEEVNFKKLLADRIDVYQTSEVVGWSTIKKLFTPEEVKQFAVHPKVFSEDEYFVLFSKKSPNGKMFFEKFDSGFKKLKASGKYDEILKKYLGK